MLKDKNILYVVHKYNSFQKDPIKEASRYFKNVYVLVRFKPFASIIKYLPFKKIKAYDEKIILDLNKLPSNVKVIKTPVWYLPFGIFNKWLGEQHYKSVQKVIDKEGIDFDIIHSHFIWSSGYVGVKLKEKYNVPLVITGHGFDVYKLPFQNAYWQEKIKEIADKADVLLTVSDSNKEKLKEIKIPASKIVVLYNGFSPKTFYPMDTKSIRKELKIKGDEKICVSVGNLESIKGFDILIKAIKKIVEKGIKIKCYILGEGSQRNNLENLIKQLHLENIVYLIGPREHSQVGKWINICDLFVIPSRMESASVVLLEALACGKPVIGTNTGLIPKVLDNKSGIVVNTDDVDSLANGIEDGFKKSFDRKDIVEKVKNLSWENSVKSLIKIYNKLLKIHD